MSAVRERLKHLTRERRGSHAGLVLKRYYAGDDSEGNERNVNRRNVLEHAQRACEQAHGVYKLAFERWEEETRGLPGGVLRIRSRLITGLGNKGVLETGIRLHYTYGTPIIPGSGLKGLAAHYCRSAYGADTEEAPISEMLFGSTGSGGHITYQDAWILPECIAELTKEGRIKERRNREGLLMDVMTPHHGEYYAGKEVPPHDSEDPNPVSFLSVRGKFRIVVECDVSDENGQKWAELALRILEEALHKDGVGGKTSSGYGRMARDKAKKGPKK